MSSVFHNAQIVLSDEVLHGSVRVADGEIVEISDDPELAPNGSVIEDLGGDYLMPGLVELHTDQVEAHFQPRPKRFWDPVPAVIAHDAQMAASGVTTVLDALRIGTGPSDGNSVAESARTLVDAVIHAAEADLLRADHYVHLRCEIATADVLDMFDELGAHERVRLVSLMDHTPGQRQFADVEHYRTYMTPKWGMSAEQFEAHVTQLAELSARYSIPHRAMMAERARGRGITMATHDDATTQHVDESSALGVRISEFPTTVEAARAAREAGQLILMGSPNIVRGGSHSGNVAAADLLAAGLLDILSSDYVPASTLQAVFMLFADDTITLPQGSALVSANPARASGLDDRGRIETGTRADLIRVHMREGVPTPKRPAGATVPIVRGVWREGRRVS
ncbi:alpha-D-ribose 1-methylphosphonate 5-triphosphate diphosphatase [Microbacterium sp.]|uniref:alpha-D-ribose 1-methylphosphonate 5-triphosphate diphosphatase n=1 Tax=Microbacterium sp. TaxID=51671 RepID=UPI003C73C35C